MGSPLYTFNKRVYNWVKFVEGSLCLLHGEHWREMEQHGLRYSRGAEEELFSLPLEEV